MKVLVHFSVDVSWCEESPRLTPPLALRIQEAVAEAVTNALARGQSEGHVHAMSDEIAILMDSAVTARLELPLREARDG